MRAARDPIVHYYVRNYAHHTHMFGGINFGNLVKNSPIHQIKIPTKVSVYTVHRWWYLLVWYLRLENLLNEARLHA